MTLFSSTKISEHDTEVRIILSRASDIVGFLYSATINIWLSILKKTTPGSIPTTVKVILNKLKQKYFAKK